MSSRKKIVLKMLLAAGVCFLLIPAFFLSCSPKRQAGKTALEHGVGVETDFMFPDEAVGVYFANDEALKAAFTLDYRPETPEREQYADSLSADDLSGGAKSSFQGQRIIPGLRKLQDYKTPYFDPLKNAERIAEIKAAMDAAAGDTGETGGLQASLPQDSDLKPIVSSSKPEAADQEPPRRFFGQPEIMPPKEKPVVGYAHFLDYGNAMLEAQFPPRFLFEYKNNTADSWYGLGSNNNPFSKIETGKQIFQLAEGEKNYRYFEEIDLSPYLNSGKKGFVSFNANLQLLSGDINRTTGKKGVYNAENKLNIQVTDLGITVRYGFNKAAVMVTSLSTGEPVENAAVKILSPELVENSPDISEVENFGFGTTDKNGFTVIDIDAGVMRRATRNQKYSWYDTPFFLAEKENDRAVFAANDHNVWRYNIFADSPQYAERVENVTFMFTDRGLYKPGEKITFRGVDRSLVLGMYTIYKGEWKVSLEEQSYYDGEELAFLAGTTSESGGFSGVIETPDTLMPGAYKLVYRRMNEDGAMEVSANMPITVAYFERLKFQASISTPVMSVVSGDDINLQLTASYLSGGNLSGSNWTSGWYRSLTGFYPNTAETQNYVFGPRNAYDGKQYVGEESGSLQANGNAALNKKTGGDSVAGAAYMYSVEATVTDISNQSISASRQVLVHPARFWLGLKPQRTNGFTKTGEESSFDYMAVDTEGMPLTSTNLFLKTGANADKIIAELVREDWRRVQQKGVNGYIYDNYEREEVVENTQTLDAKVSGSITVKPEKAGYHILRITAFDRNGKKALTERGFYVTGSDFGYWNMNNPQEIKLTADKAVYNPGETAKVLLQSSLSKGHYLVTVEREGIFTQEVRYIEEGTSVIDVPVARNFVPVVYVSVASYSVRKGEPSHNYGEADLDKPTGYFGVIKLFVNKRVRAFSVKVESDKKVYQSGDEVNITLTAERDGKPLANAELTLMAVDRGVLDLINYHVPDPIDFFYNESRFNLKTQGGDSRNMLLDPVTYSVKNLAGGDAGDKIEERADFNPLAVFEPCLVTDKNGKVKCTFKLPDTLTTYRVTVFGVRGDLFSLKETEVAVQNKINVAQVQPRRLRERDTAEAGVLITNMDSSSHKVRVSLSIEQPKENNDSGFTAHNGAAFIDGAFERTLTVKSGEQAVVYFDVAAEKQGDVSLVYTIESDVLSERLISPITIEKPYVTETFTAIGSLVDTSSAAETVVIPSFADDGIGNLSVTLDATRLSLLESSVNYLFHYPYGCMEQRSAAILPLIIFGEYIEALNLRNEVEDPVKVVENELKEWAKVQLPSGGFPYWQSGTEADSYVSLRIAHILALAKNKNYRIPDSIKIASLLNYLENEYTHLQRLTVNDWDYNSRTYLQAYMLYIFSLFQVSSDPLSIDPLSIDPSRLSELTSRPNADPSVLAFAGMAYKNTGRNAEAEVSAKKLRGIMRLTPRGVELTAEKNLRWNYFYGGETEQLALSLEFFAMQFPNDEINTRLLHTLLMSRRGGASYWNNTAVTVRILQAVDQLIRSENLDKTDESAAVSIDGRELLEGTFKGLGAKPETKTFDFKAFPLAALQRDARLPLNIKKDGIGNIYWTASLTYAIPPELQSVRNEGIGVSIKISEALSGDEIKDNILESGKLYRAAVHVSSSGRRNFLALRIPVPSGTEILDTVFVTTAAADRNQETPAPEPSHKAIMDNEVRFFWDNLPQTGTDVQFLFRAARRGVYPTPPLQAECMYEPEIFGRTSGVLWMIK